MLKIYVANLGKYNEGELVGKWISLPASAEELEQLYIDIKVAHRNKNGEFIPCYTENGVIYEEVAIHDYESDIDGLHINEYDDINELNALAEELEEIDEDGILTIKAIQQATGYDLRYAIDHKDDAVLYANMTIEDVAEYLVESGCFGNIPDSIANYIDYVAIARDLHFDGYHEVDAGVIYVG